MMAAKAVDPETGLLCFDKDSWTNWEPVEMGAGSVIAGARDGYRYRIARYARKYDESLAREYCYDEESNWTTLIPGSADGEWARGDCKFVEDCFVRITVQREDGFESVRPYTLGEMVELEYVPPVEAPLPAWAGDEVNRVVKRVGKIREPGDLVFVVLTDIHYATGCIWPETARNLRAIADRLHPNAVIQLGDVTDGLAPVEITRSLISRVFDDLERCGAPVYSCIGNHDVNYFRDNEERLSKGECARLYLDRESPWYYVDFDSSRLRCLFLDSFDPARRRRYGFSACELRWARQIIDKTPGDWKLLVFSHVPPLAEIHYWSKSIVNGPRLIRMLERRNRRYPGSVLAFIHGHNHVDQIYRRQSFPIVSIGCAKYEDFPEYKPDGGITPAREAGTSSQDLWDILVVKADGRALHFVRFGAGDDRDVVIHGAC